MGAIAGAGPHVRGVSSQSLATYMYLNMPDYAAVEGVPQQPELLPAIFLDNDYVIVAPTHENAVPAAWPSEGDGDAHAPSWKGLSDDAVGGGWAKGDYERMDRTRTPDAAPLVPMSAQAHVAMGMGRDEDQVVDTVESISSEWRGPFWDRVLSEAESNPTELSVDAYLFGLFTADSVQNDLFLANGNVKQGAPAAPDRLTFDLSDSYDVRAGVLNVADIYVPMPLAVSDILNLATNVRLPFADAEQTPSDGVHMLGWYNMYEPRYSQRLNPWQVLQGLMTGTVNASAIPTLAKDLRFAKHSDPIFGIVAAYLYDRVGDVNSIRRLCAYYQDYGQAVPFDIALLARVPFKVTVEGGYKIKLPDIPEDIAAKKADLPKFVWNAMQGRTVGVSGIVPVLTTGWGRLTTLSRDPNVTRFAKFQQHLQDTPIACFCGHELGKDLIDMMLDIYQG